MLFRCCAVALAVFGVALVGWGVSQPWAGSTPTVIAVSPAVQAEHTVQPAFATPPKRAPVRRIEIADFDYEPSRLVVRRGTRVRWTNRDISNHTVTFSRSPGDLGNLDDGQSRSARFKRAGIFGYVCTLHPNMKAKVVVLK